LSLHLSHLYGLTIESPFALPGASVLPAPVEAVDLEILWEDEMNWREIVRPLPIGSDMRDGPRMGAAPDGGLCVEWRRELQLVIAPLNDRITVVCRPAKLEFAPTVLVGIGMGLLLHRRGVVCLHGSVVSAGGRNFALLGDSGAGKSTAAAALVAGGGELISDDLAALRPSGDAFLVERGCANVRLHEAAKAQILGTDLQLDTAPWIDKLLWDVSADRPIAGAASIRAARLDAIYLLRTTEGSGAIDIGSPLPPMRSLPRLVEAWYPQGCTPLLTQARFETLRTIAERVPLYELRYPRRWDILPQLVAALGA